jgi:hypothetical protein
MNTGSAPRAITILDAAFVCSGKKKSPHCCGLFLCSYQ